METITEYFFEHFNNVSDNRIVYIQMDSFELSEILFGKNNKFRISCEALGGATMYQDLMNFDRNARFDKDDYYIATTEKSYQLFMKLYNSNKIIDLIAVNPSPQIRTYKGRGMILSEALNSIPDKTDRYVSQSYFAKLRIFSRLSDEIVEILIFEIEERTGLQNIQVEFITEDINDCLFELELIF